MFGNSKATIGLDLGTTGARAVEVVWREGRPVVERAAAITYGSPITDWRNADQRELAGLIQEITTRRGMRGRWVAHAVCGESVAAQYFNFPQLMPEDVAEAVRIEVESALPFRADSALISYLLFPEQRLGQGKVRTHGLAIAADGGFIEARVGPIRRAGLEAFCVETDATACANALIGSSGLNGHANGTSALLNIGYRYSNLALIGNTSTLLVRDVPWAGAHLTEEIATRLGIQSVEAEDLKRAYWEKGAEAAGQLPARMLEILQAGARDFVVRLHDTIEYWVSEKLVMPLSRVYLTGGGSLVRELPDFLGQALNVPVQRWTPPLNGKLSERTALDAQMSVAYGLALHAFETRNNHG